MKTIVVDLLIGVSIACAWLGAIGLARMASALDRLHAVAFVTVGSGLAVVAAAFVADGPSTRAFKILVLWLIALIAGAAVNMAAARAIFTRDEAGERT